MLLVSFAVYTMGILTKLELQAVYKSHLVQSRILLLIVALVTIVVISMTLTVSLDKIGTLTRSMYGTDDLEVSRYYSGRLVDQPNSTDATMQFMHTASAAVEEAQRIQLQIYKELIGHYTKAILIGIANHENKGDSAITVGEMVALKKLGIEVIYYCSSYSCKNFEDAKAILKDIVEPVVVLASGGGNFCIWKGECTLRERMVKAFPDRQVVLFPQSVAFTDEDEMKQHANIMNSHPNITYLFRDHRSYSIIVNSGVFRYNRAVLCPDAAMQIGTQQLTVAPIYDIVWLKRQDKESQFRSTSPTISQNLSVFVGDWINVRGSYAGSNLLEVSHKRLSSGLEFLSRGKVVISDRLHAHILSVLLGKPNVMLDNSYKKVTSFHDTWTPSVDNVLVAVSEEDALVKAQHLLHKYYY